MILNIKINNYRSFKDEVTFSMIAESSKSKEQNIFEQPLAQGEDAIRLLKTAVIYGANASGKSNLFRALFEIKKFLGRSKPNVGEKIPAYDPFLFSSESMNSPVEFSIEFVIANIKYRYELSFDRKNVVKEELTYWPNNKQTMLFTRKISSDTDSIKHIGQIGAILKGKEIDVFHNQAFLSKFGEEIPNEIISGVYLYMAKIEVINTCSSHKISNLKKEVSEKFATNPAWLNKMNELLRFADTGLNSIFIKDVNEGDILFPKDIPDSAKGAILKDFKYFITGKHKFFEKEKLMEKEGVLPFEEESNGTNTIFALGGRILEAIENGEVLFVDELETNLHPFLSKLLVCLFQNERINKKNAQLIFTTHDITLLDRALLRKDQVWFTEKDNYGISILYSLQDFTDVREDTPFDKWYMAGKFGGVPNLKSLESLFVE